jgi:uncharacterized protein with LGFP repeats
MAVTITGAVVTAVASLAGSASGASPATTASAHNGPQGGGPHTAAVSAAAAQAVPAVSALQVVANADDWYIAPNNPPYNQAGYWQSRTDYAGDGRGDNPRPGGTSPAWREDCSGFLAHAWGEADSDGGFTTYTMGSYSTPIAWSQLQAGDALLFNGTVVGGQVINHAALFLRWDSPTTYSVMDESTPGSGSHIQDNIPVGTDGFWQYGQPVRYDGLVNSPVAGYYSQLGGSASYLGTPTDSPYAVAGGQAQDFTGGTIYWSPATGAHAVHGAILTHYQALGGPGGFLGFPVTDETGTPDGIGRFNHFANDGSIYWTSPTGAWSVHGAVRDHWQALGWEAGPLGYPTTDELGTPDGVGRFNAFSKDAAIYWTPQTGAWSVRGAVRDHWASLGWETGPLGYPTSDELGTPDGVGRFNNFFKGGAIYWTPRTGAWSVRGAIYSLWAAMGWETSTVGYPTSDEYAIPGGRRNNFVSGIISWNAATGVTTAGGS